MPTSLTLCGNIIFNIEANMKTFAVQVAKARVINKSILRKYTFLVNH